MGARRGACSTGKVRFDDEDEARARVVEIARNPVGVSAYVPTNAIHCHICHGWHLTSKGVKPRRAGKRQRF